MFQLIQVPDFRDLKLPDGRLAKDVGLHDLRRVLQRLGVADISPASGMQELLSAYRQHLDAKAAAAEAERVRLRESHLVKPVKGAA